MTTLKRIYGPLVSAQTYRDSLYLFVGLALGLLWSTVMITLYAVGIGTAVVWIGVVILLGTQALLRPIGALERLQVRWLLRRPVAAPAPLDLGAPMDEGRPSWRRLARGSRALIHDRHSWQVLGWIMLRLVTGPIGFTLVVVYVSVSLALLAAPFSLVWTDLPPGQTWDRWLLLGPLAFLVAAPMLAWAIRGFADLHRLVAGPWLGPCGDEVRAAALARASRAEEQIRIDQELHDSIGHMISMIVVQAGAGAHVFDRDPAFARRALTTIGERGRAALGELDRLIARIRGDEPETTAPLPDASDLPHLVDGARDAGIAVTARLDAGDVPAPIGRGVYRVVQEALTNAAKHAPGQPVDVSVVSGDDCVAITVRNPVDGATDDGARGNGLASIRDRVALMGGHATVGVDGRGGFSVRAVLPIDTMLRAEDDADCRMTTRCQCLVCRVAGRVRA